MSVKPVMRDERTVSVENASYRIAYLVTTYGLLLSVAYRSFVLKQQSWDLMALVMVGGSIAAAYQRSQGVLTTRSAKLAALAVMAAALIAVFVRAIR